MIGKFRRWLSGFIVVKLLRSAARERRKAQKENP